MRASLLEIGNEVLHSDTASRKLRPSTSIDNFNRRLHGLSPPTDFCPIIPRSVSLLLCFAIFRPALPLMIRIGIKGHAADTGVAADKHQPASRELGPIPVYAG